MIEVKSVGAWDFVSYRISRRQKQRLIRVYHYFQRRFALDVTLELALVPGDGDILFIEIEFIFILLKMLNDFQIYLKTDFYSLILNFY